MLRTVGRRAAVSAASGFVWVCCSLTAGGEPPNPDNETQVVTARIYVMTVLVAGLRHHEAKQVWEELAVGDALVLVREPENRSDGNAVRVEWNGHPLGYLPQERNRDVARQMDRGQTLMARITQIAKYRNHRKKLEVEIFVRM